MNDQVIEPLKPGEVPDGADPFDVFAAWFSEATQREPNDPSAMALSTVDADGLPNVRMVLMKGYDRDGFVFYTNTESQKGVELAAGMKAAAVFHWKSLRRQVRLRGPVRAVRAAEADAYFESRPRDSRIGAWASQQSRPMADRFALEKAVAAYAFKFGVGPVPRPAHWTGFRIAPLYLEFWQDKPFRLHERHVFRRATPDGPFDRQRLFP